VHCFMTKTNELIGIRKFWTIYYYIKQSKGGTLLLQITKDKEIWNEIFQNWRKLGIHILTKRRESKHFFLKIEGSIKHIFSRNKKMFFEMKESCGSKFLECNEIFSHLISQVTLSFWKYFFNCKMKIHCSCSFYGLNSGKIMTEIWLVH
jgi:hypothetical protein